MKFQDCILTIPQHDAFLSLTATPGHPDWYTLQVAGQPKRAFGIQTSFRSDTWILFWIDKALGHEDNEHLVEYNAGQLPLQAKMWDVMGFYKCCKIAFVPFPPDSSGLKAWVPVADD